MGKRRYERRGTGYSTLYYDPVTGKRRRVTLPTQEAIDDFLAETRRKARQGTYVDPTLGRMPFTEFADEFVAGLSHLSPGGYRNVETNVRLHIKPYLEGETVASITPAKVRAWLGQLKRTGKASSSIGAIYGVFKRMMDTAVFDGLRAASPCAGITLPASDAVREEHVYLDPRQVYALSQAIDPRYSALILLGAYGGLRIAEMIALWAEDCRLDGDDPHVIVRASMEDLGSGQRRKTTKTDKVRRVSLPAPVARQLGAHVAHFPPHPEGYVFTSPRGYPVARRNFYRRHFKPAVLAAGLPERTRVHDLRHTCAALLISGGESLSVVAAHLGHRTERTTERYKHLLPSANKSAVSRLAAAFAEVRQPG
jgi:integrase